MRLVFIMLLTLILVSNVYALDCQYTETLTSTSEQSMLVVTKTGEAYGPSLTLSNYHNGEKVGNNINKPGFDAFNNLNERVTVAFNVFVKDSQGERKIETDVSINPQQKTTVTIDCDYSSSSTCQLLSEQTGYTVVSPHFMTEKIVEITDSQEVCVKCNGINCLNDGASCSSDYQCGSGVCNIAGYCDNEEIVTCPEGTLNCMDESCVVPRVKENNEAYLCMFQCQSGYGIDGVCLRDSRKDYLYWIAGIFIVIIALGFGIFKLYEKMKKIQMELIDADRKRAEEEKESSLTKIRLIDMEIKNLEEEIAKKKRLSKEHEEENKKLQELKNEKEETLKGIMDITYELNNKSQEYYIKLYNERYGEKIYTDNKGYFRFESNKKLLHRYIYESHFGKIGKTDVIHHIDANHFNNEIWNLVKLTYGEHSKVNHGRIEFGNWNEGIKELLEVIPEDRLHEKIKEKLKEKTINNEPQQHNGYKKDDNIQYSKNHKRTTSHRVKWGREYQKIKNNKRRRK